MVFTVILFFAYSAGTVSAQRRRLSVLSDEMRSAIEDDLNNYDSRHNQAERDATNVSNNSRIASQMSSDPSIDGKKAQEIINENARRSVANSVRDPGAYSASNCAGAAQNASSNLDESPNTANLFSDEILIQMNKFMQDLYKRLSQPMMIGHSLICYAKNVAYNCIGLGKDGKEICIIKLYNMNLFISGIIIYIVGVLMTMSIGMYFVDISFKLGFAMIFMPISIALWPFPPTKNKLQDNLSTIIRNGMLFALVSIGVSISTTLLSASLFPKDSSIDGETAFWAAIANKSTETLIENFAFDDFHFLIIGFGLIFAFKILASSVNDYLDYFFSDAIFGSESPMHHMGTQAVGMVAANTVKPAAAFMKDVAKTQTGRAISGLGGGIAKLGSASGRKNLADNIKGKAKSIKNVVTHPRQSYNAAMSKLGEKTGKAVEKTGGSLAKGVVNAALLFLPWKDSTRQKWEKSADEWLDKKAQSAGKWVDKKISKGGEQLQNLAADTAAFGVNAYNKATHNKSAKFVDRDDIKNAVNASIDSVKDDLQTLKNNGLKENVKQGIVKAATAAHNLKEAVHSTSENMISEEDMREKLHDIKEDINEKYVEPITQTAKIYAEPITDPLKKGAQKVSQRVQKEVDIAKQGVQELKSGVQDKFDKLTKTKLAKATKEAWKESDKAPVTLQLSALISAPFKGAKGAVKGTYKHLTSMNSWINDMAKLATGWEKFQKAKEDKVILKKSGQIVMRTMARSIKGSGQDVKKFAEGTASVFGNILKDFGESLQNNARGESGGWTSWRDIHDREERKKEASREERDFYSSLSDNYENDK